MKYLLFVGCFLLSLSGFSQKSKVATTPQTLQTETVSKKDLDPVEKNIMELSSVLELTDQQKAMFRELFTTKNRMLKDATGASEERKTIIYETIARKIEASIPADQFEKLKANKEVFHSITH